ncbi:MAG: FHA domain-containing protein [Chloroflexi bacterium]|nr:FHA domain-containing protein [Chloroflexota bacterium]
MQANERFRLVVRRGPQPNQVYELNKDIITLGRDITNDITINDPEVSRHHMRLTRGAGGFTLEDLGSTNGTFVNAQRLTGAKPLNNGDMIGLGETVTLGYELVRTQAAPAPSAEVGPEMAPTSSSPAARAPQPPAQQPSPFGYAPAPEPVYTPPQAPPGPGYDYDPYAMREEEPRSAARWLLIGCAGISLLCCCGTLVGAFLVDQLCLWSRIPIVWDILQALGYSATCG